MVEQELTWVGLRVGEFLIDSAVGEGAFSYVYKGVKEDGSTAAFKVAKPRDLIIAQPTVERAPTQAICFQTGIIQGVHPGAVELLTLQAYKISAAQDPALPTIHKVVAEEGFAYYQMELLDGRTLRSELDYGSLPLAVLIETARTLDRLSKNSAFEFHGDLKPENIMVTVSGVKIIDPGHFGPLQCQEANFKQTAVTTPAYYPCMEPNDLFAFGLILYEVAVGEHPLMGELDVEQSDPGRITPELIAWVRSYEQVGLYFLRSLYQMDLPCDARPALSDQCQDFLLKALGLRLTSDGRIDKGPSFGSFAEIANELESLESAGWTSW